jgi:UDP:flavonoid glycosyltransferase YjiC (YdhE family)
VPQLVLPSQYEQYLTARRIEQLGAGLWLGLESRPDEVRTALERLLQEPSFPGAARAYASRYRAYSAAESQRRIAARIEEILTQPAHPRELPLRGTPPGLGAASNGPGATR